MKNQQKGFTLVEIAIVLVIIGLLLGGVLKGQELINSAKVKNIAADFKNVQVAIYGYQDKFKRLPGDDSAANTNVSSSYNGNHSGAIQGKWNETAIAGDATKDETVYFWDHVRRANLISGSTIPSGTTDATALLPTNAEGGRIGVSSAMPIKNMNGGTFYMCSDGLIAKFARQVDLTLDDGNPGQGSVMAIAQDATSGASKADGSANADTSFDETKRYTICMTF